MPSVLSAKHFHDEQAAFDFLEARVWPNGAVCPHCGGFDRISKMGGKATRLGLYKCYQCRKQFTVKVGTVFESSHVPLNVWLQAVALLTSSKKGISSNQLHRVLGVTLKTAWFMSHRIREAMRSGDLAPLDGGGGIVEADETYQGRRSTPRDVTTSGRPSSRRARRALRRSVQSSRLSSAVARSVPFTSKTPTRRPSIRSSPRISRARRM